MRDFYTPVVSQPVDQPVSSLACILTRRPPPFTETLANIGKRSGETLKLRESEEHARLVMAGEANVRVKRKRSVNPNSCSEASTSKSVPTAAPPGPANLWRRLRGRYDNATTPSPRDDVLSGGHNDQGLPAATRITPFGRPSTSRVPADRKPSSSTVAPGRRLDPQIPSNAQTQKLPSWLPRHVWPRGNPRTLKIRPRPDAIRKRFPSSKRRNYLKEICDPSSNPPRS
ncbi:hypothetical protein BS47DRAFT_1350135, partial [Hydnum rufescens UP504]